MFIWIALLYLTGSALCCPPAESLLPFCSCRAFGKDNALYCRKLVSHDDLVAPIRRVAMNNHKIFSLQIENSSLLYIPSGLFKDTGIERIRFFGTELLSLSDSDLAFEGLEDTLHEIRATEAPFAAQWDWQQLRMLKKLDLIDVNYLTLGGIEQVFPELPNLVALGLTRADISSVVDGAFVNLPKLKILNLKQNSISELKRSMLSDPAEHLSLLDLRQNKLSTLPDDFFTNIPNLQDVNLDQNRFLTLPEKVFNWPLMYLRELTMTENEIRCDCRIRWLAGVRTPFVFAAKCTSPESLTGRELKSLKIKELKC